MSWPWRHEICLNAVHVRDDAIFAGSGMVPKEQPFPSNIGNPEGMTRAEICLTLAILSTSDLNFNYLNSRLWLWWCRAIRSPRTWKCFQQRWMINQGRFTSTWTESVYSTPHIMWCAHSILDDMDIYTISYWSACPLHYIAYLFEAHCIQILAANDSINYN